MDAHNGSLVVTEDEELYSTPPSGPSLDTLSEVTGRWQWDRSYGGPQRIGNSLRFRLSEGETKSEN